VGKASKAHYWEYFYEDSVDLIAKLPRIAALVYRHKYHNDKFIETNNSLDWAGNYAHMLGYPSLEVKECIRGYLSIHRYIFGKLTIYF
jgi:citrate synthase